MSRPTEPRIPPLDTDDLTDDQRDVLGPLTDFRGRPMNIFATLAHHPKLLKRWLVFGTHVLMKGTLDPRHRELLILRTAWNCQAEYEFGHHAEIGAESGLTTDEIVATTGDGSAFVGLDALLLAAADELHADSCIGPDTWEALDEHLTTEQVLDLIFAVGQYHLVSMALNSCGVQLEEGTPGFPA